MRVIVVEDEPLARDGLCAMLAMHPSIDVVGSYATADAARHAIRGSSPDAMFVDVEMPGEGGVELVRSIPVMSRPHVVFVTAHENYAAKAFDVDAVDYVLKPIDDARLAQAVARVQRLVDAPAHAVERSESRAGELAGDSNSEQQIMTRISARVGDRLVVMKLSEVSWIEADGDYMRVHAKGRSLLVRMTMRDLERRLDPAQFVRVHRSAVVNIDAISSVDMGAHGDYVAILTDGERVKVGRSHRVALLESLGERP